MKIGIVTGMRREQKSLPLNKNNDDIQVRVSGANSDRAERVAETLVKEGCGVLLSYGFSGGIDPKLVPGDLIIADRVFSEYDHIFFASEEWRHKIIDLQPLGKTVHTGPVVGLDFMLHSVCQKAEAYMKYSALAVDMESHRVGLVAKKYDIPFLVIRTVLDSARMTVPNSIASVIDCKGDTNYFSMILNLGKNPRDILDLLVLVKCYHLAFNKLKTTKIF